jgi:membrane protein implicated in regulation of membrane protease activity
MPILWLLLAVGLAIAEVFTTTFVLLMFAVGALAAAGVAALDAPVYVQGLAFAAVSALALFGVRPVLRRHLHLGGARVPMGVEAIEGSTGLVMEAVDAERGVVRIEGETWLARAYDASQTYAVGERVRVVEIKGATALVWRD